jgi:hypothetical protein
VSHACCAAAVLLLAESTLEAPRFERAIEVVGPGRVAVPLDAAVYAEARGDLADLRLLDDKGALVPFVLDCDPVQRAAPLRPRVLNRVFLAGREAGVTLDFGEKRRKAALSVSLPGENFRRRVIVEGSDDGRDFATLVDDAWLFAIPGADGARYERIPLPENDHRYLRLRVELGPDDPKRIEIGEVSAEGEGTRPRARALAVPVRRYESAETRETLLVIDLPGARHPFREIRLEVDTRSYLRSVRVEAQRLTRPVTGRSRATPSPDIEWAPLGAGMIYRYESGGRLYENTRLAVSGRERRLRLRIRNGDDAPLGVRGAAVSVPRERVLFEAEPGRLYRLSYGRERAAPPSFDLQRTLPDPSAWAAGAQQGRLGAPLRLGDGAAAQRPWTERHPALLWAGIVFVALSLGAITWRALRDA